MLEVRDELLHPMLLHFPIAFFALSLLLKSAELICMKWYKNTLIYISISNKIILGLGAFTYLLSLFLGDIALDAIKDTFCDLSAVYAHEDLAHNALYVFIAAIALEAIVSIKTIVENKIAYPILQFIVFGMLLTGNYIMAQTAHMGAELVYEKGAAVKTQSSNDCKQF